MLKENLYNVFRLKPGSETVSKTFRIPIEITGQLEKLAFDNNLSLNAVVVQCLEYALDNIDTAESTESKSDFSNL